MILCRVSKYNCKMCHVSFDLYNLYLLFNIQFKYYILHCIMYTYIIHYRSVKTNKRMDYFSKRNWI